MDRQLSLKNLFKLQKTDLEIKHYELIIILLFVNDKQDVMWCFGFCFDLIYY